MAKSYAAKGTTISMGDGASPEVFTAIAHINDVDGPGSKRETVDVTHHGSTSKEFVATLLDSGEVKFQINYDPAEATHKNAAGGLIFAHEAGTVKNFKIAFPALVAAGPTFAAIVTDFQTKAPVAGKLSAEVTLKISGAITWPSA